MARTGQLPLCRGLNLHAQQEPFDLRDQVVIWAVAQGNGDRCALPGKPLDRRRLAEIPLTAAVDASLGFARLGIGSIHGIDPTGLTVTRGAPLVTIRHPPVHKTDPTGTGRLARAGAPPRRVAGPARAILIS